MDLLDRLPLPVLLALQEAAATPTEEGAERARRRAADAGYYLVSFSSTRRQLEPLCMEEAPEGVEGVVLTFADRVG